MNSVRSNYLSKAYLISFFLMGLFPVVPFSVKPFLLGPLVLVSVFNLFFTPSKNIDWRTILVNTGVFLLFFYSYFYSDNDNQAGKQIVRLLPFLVLPLGFALVPKEVYDRASLLFFRVFTIGCGLFSILMFVYAYYLKSEDLGYVYSHITFEFWGYREHPIYISLYLGIALILLLWNSKKDYLNILLFVIISAALLFLTRKGNIISLLIVGIIALASHKKLIFHKNLIRYSVLVIIVLGFIIFFFDNYISTRFQEIFIASEWKNPVTSTGIRNIVLQVCADLSFERPFFGYGLGDVQDDINTRLIRLGYSSLTVVHQYNAHNQYLQIVLCSGYLGLVWFLGILLYNFLKVYRIQRKIGLYIFLYIVFCFVFESLLERQNGAIVAAIFLNLFAFNTQNENNRH